MSEAFDPASASTSPTTRAHARESSASKRPTPETKAATLLTNLRRSIVSSMVEYLIQYEERYEDCDPDERYNFGLQELEDRFLSKLNTVRRALTEVYALPSMAATAVSQVIHLRVASPDEIGERLSSTIRSLGRVNVVDVSTTRGEDGFDIIVTYQSTKRGDSASRSAKARAGKDGQRGERGGDERGNGGNAGDGDGGEGDGGGLFG